MGDILNEHNIVLIVQARMGSSRLPGKVMKDISGKPMLWHIIERLKNCLSVNSVVVATSDRDGDDTIAKLAGECGVGIFRGDEHDVLDRYYHASVQFRADIIVRVCGDCPLIDPTIIDEMILEYLGNCSCIDYVGMSVSNMYPYGLDAEVFPFGVLEKAWREARLPSEREHVTPYIWKNPGIFRLSSLKAKADLSRYIWAVDNECDLKFVRAVYKHLYKPGQLFLTDDVLSLIKEKPEIQDINKNSIRSEGYKKSIKLDGSSAWTRHTSGDVSREK